MRPRLALLIGIIVAAAGIRLCPHPANFDPIGGLALFAGAHMENRRRAFIPALAAMLLSDALIGFHTQMPVVYGAFALIVCLGFALRRQRGPLPVAGMALAASVLFFVATNLGVWAFDGMYPKSLAGLVACYVAALPFFGMTVAGNLFYAAVLFGGFALAERRIPLVAPAARS